MAFNRADSSSEDETELDDYKGKNAIMFLIDFRENMLDLDTKLNKSYFRQCLNTCKTLMTEIARSGKDDLVGVSLIGTERGTKDGTPLLANIQPLGSVSADLIKTIDEIIVDRGEGLKDKYGRIGNSSNLNLVKILNSCLKLFLECTKKIYTKTVVIMTRDDDPFGDDIQSAHLARKQAKKLSYAAIDLAVVGLGSDFEPNKFYNELIALTRGEVDRDWAKVNRVKQLGDIDNHLTALMSRLSRTNRDLAIGRGVTIPISLYKLYKEPKVKFQRKVVNRCKDDEDSGSDKESDMKNATDNPVTSTFRNRRQVKADMIPLVGGKPINLTKSELDKAEFHDIEAGLKLIGFMPSVDIPEYLSVVPPRVMLPNYFSRDGISAFACLLETCREEKLSMVCWYRYNQHSNISLVVCHPMSQQSDTKGNVCPDGFCIVTIPFSDNYDDPETDKLDAEPSSKQMEAARQIVKKLTVGYSVNTFHDFDLQKTLAMVEALALDYDEVPIVTDDTILEDENTDDRIANFIQDFNDCTHLGVSDSVAAAKRPAGATSYRASKNPKLNSMDGLLETIKEGKADMLTVAQLKNILDSQGILFAPSARKAKLVELATSRIK